MQEGMDTLRRWPRYGPSGVAPSSGCSALAVCFQDSAFGRAHQQRRLLRSGASRYPDLLEQVCYGVTGSCEGCSAPIEHVGVVATGNDPGDGAAGMKAGGFEYLPPDVDITPDDIVRVLRSDYRYLALHPPDGPDGVLNRHASQWPWPKPPPARCLRSEPVTCIEKTARS